MTQRVSWARTTQVSTVRAALQALADAANGDGTPIVLVAFVHVRHVAGSLAFLFP